MAPQPLPFVVKGDKQISFGGTAVSTRHESAIWLAQAVASWSMVDATTANLFITLTGDRWEDAADLYAAIESERAKDAALKALALAFFSKAEHDKFNQQLSAMASARKARNKFAHWVWGECTQVKDGLIAIDPRHLGRHVAKMLAGKARSRDIDLEKVYVFTTNYIRVQALQFEELARANSTFTELAHLAGTERVQRFEALSQFSHLSDGK